MSSTSYLPPPPPKAAGIIAMQHNTGDEALTPSDLQTYHQALLCPIRFCTCTVALFLPNQRYASAALIIASPHATILTQILSRTQPAYTCAKCSPDAR